MPSSAGGSDLEQAVVDRARAAHTMPRARSASSSEGSSPINVAQHVVGVLAQPGRAGGDVLGLADEPRVRRLLAHRSRRPGPRWS